MKAAAKLAAHAKPATKAATERAVCCAIKDVAEELGNTAAVCRKSYVHPAVIEAFTTVGFPKSRAAEHLSATETRVLKLLEG